MADVRGRGFSGRVPLSVAQSWIDAQVSALDPRAVPLAGAAGLVLARPVVSDAALPPADRAVRDGFAVAAADTLGAGSYNPVLMAFAQPVQAGQPLPEGCDAVLPAEAAQSVAGLVEAFDSVAPGSGVERRAAAAAAGIELLPAGRRLRPADLGLLGAIGFMEVPVVPPPRVRILLAGGPRDGNEALAAMMVALVRRDGGLPEVVGPLVADRAGLAEAFAAPGADLVLVAGRTGVGEEDVAPLALADAGALALHGIAMRPGDSAGLGLAGGVPAVLLPGEPMAALATYEHLGGRVVRRRAGRPAGLPHPVRQAVAARKLVSEIGSDDLYRVRLTADGLAEPVASPAMPGLAAAARADGFVMIPAESEGVAAGAAVTIYLFD